MIDFHSHILPQMDDGAASVPMSLAMLRQSFLQNVDVVVSTSHFYADEDYPDNFLRRRTEAFGKLCDAMLMSVGVFPEIMLGAEVLYFPEISQAEDVAKLTIGNSGCILIEPPMAPWTDNMLDEIVRMGENYHCKPIIAHVDRYMNVLQDEQLIHRVLERNMIVQVNADYFINKKTQITAFNNLKKGYIQLIGSDCHNLDSRAPNIGAAWRQAKRHGCENEFKKLTQNAETLLHWRG